MVLALVLQALSTEVEALTRIVREHEPHLLSAEDGSDEDDDELASTVPNADKQPLETRDRGPPTRSFRFFSSHSWSKFRRYQTPRLTERGSVENPGIKSVSLQRLRTPQFFPCCVFFPSPLTGFTDRLTPASGFPS